jgi:hypothetical protein
MNFFAGLKYILDGAGVRVGFLVMIETAVKKHIQNIYNKMQVTDRQQLMEKITSVKK